MANDDLDRSEPNKISSTGAQPPRKNTDKLFGRLSLDFAAVHDNVAAPMAGEHETLNPAMRRLRALEQRDQPLWVSREGAPVQFTGVNWTPLGPLAVPNGQTYGGARVLISGRVTAICSHPTDAAIIYIGTSRGGIWRTRDGGETWTPIGDNHPSLAIGALAIAGKIDKKDPDILYAGTGEGNFQYYSTKFPWTSAPGNYLGVGVLRITNGGDRWSHHARDLLANHSFYNIAADRFNANYALAATSRGLCRTTDGATWTALTGGGLPAIGTTVIACTDVLIDRNDRTGNTVLAAFWGSGIYRSTNALAANPAFTRLDAGLPSGGNFSRISLTQSTSNPEYIYVLFGYTYMQQDYLYDGFLGVYRTRNAAATSWERCTDSLGIVLYGSFTHDINVDPTTPDVVYVSGKELYKCQRNPSTNVWSDVNIGRSIHADNHCFAFHPTQSDTIYSGNDGGFYVSRNGGASWDDNPNEGLCLLQYEGIDNHGQTDAIVQCGTQDNGTQQYRNSPVHHHSADGDGGHCVISKLNGNKVVHSYYFSKLERSDLGGEFGSYTANLSGGLDNNGLFYPPVVISPTTERLALCTKRVYIDDLMGAAGWPGSGVALPGIAGPVSAANFATNDIIYCATTRGEVYRLDRDGSSWKPRQLNAAPLPTGAWIWDVLSLPGDPNSIVVVFSGFGLAHHVWRGTVAASGSATWSAVSDGLPDVPMYALAFSDTTHWYVGTDIGVYRTTNGGITWENFSYGLPNTAVYDLRLRSGSNLLRAATHGRGLWESRTDAVQAPMVDIFVRNHIMDIAHGPSEDAIPAAWKDLTRKIALNAPCNWWQCADIKIDSSPGGQPSRGGTNYFQFETKLMDENPRKVGQARVYVQVHNRGPLAAENVTVKLMTAGVSAGYPSLPADFWSAWPHSAGNSDWTPVGVVQTIASLPPLRPAVLEWDWTPPISADTNSCLLLVIDSGSDPLPASSRSIFDVERLVRAEKRAGLKRVQLEDTGVA